MGRPVGARVPPLALALAVVVVLAGCLGGPAGPGGQVGDGSGDGTVVLGESVRVTVTSVIDGDTVEVQYPNGTADTVRLLGVDTPETHAENTPDEFEGVPETDIGRACLREAGHDATRFVTERLLGERVRLRFDDRAPRRGYYGRLLAYVVHDEYNLNYRLLTTGHARVYDSEFTEADRFYAAEARAQANGTGVWACATDAGAAGDGGDATDGTATGTPLADGGSVLSVVTVHADAAGPDGDNLADEYVVLENGGDQPLELAGWTLTDAADHTYTFPEGATLAPGARVTVHTGTGEDTDTDRYWGRGSPVWNNDGDTVTVRDASGSVVDRYRYG